MNNDIKFVMADYNASDNAATAGSGFREHMKRVSASRVGGFLEQMEIALTTPAETPAELISKWSRTVALLILLGEYNGPNFQPDAYAFLRSCRADIPFDVLGDARRALQEVALPPALLALITPQERRLNLVLRQQISETRCKQSEAVSDFGIDANEVDPMALEVRTASFTRPDPVEPRKMGRRDVSVKVFDAALRDSAKAAFTLRRVPLEAMRTLISGAVRPTSGDVLLARVDRIRHQGRLELPTGRKATLDEGSLILVAYGDRYATDQFEAHVPMSLKPTNLIAVGGVASEMLSKSSTVRGATEITPIGLVGNERGEPLNLRDFALKPVATPTQRPRVIAVLGTSMNSGKTTTIRFMLNGLSRAGLKPGSTKVTGTGSGGDYWTMVDAGAHRMLDFTDVGYASTFRIPTDKLERAAFELVDHLIVAGSGVILVEIADGLFHEQNRELVRTDFFRNYVDGVVFAAGDALAASAGVTMLKELEIPVIGISGKLTASELMAREARKACPVPVYSREDLINPVKVSEICGMSDAQPFWTSQIGQPMRNVRASAGMNSL